MTRTLLATAALSALLALGACGPSAEEEAVASAATASAKAAKEREEAATAEAAKKQEEVDECRMATEDFTAELEEMKSRIAVGLTRADYNTQVGDIMVAYNQMDIDQLSENRWCLGSVAVPLENAFQQFSKANEVWADCFKELSCSIDDKDVNAKMQKHWLKAGTFMGDAEAAIEAHAE